MVYENTFNLPFVSSGGNDQGVIIVKVGGSCIFLREVNCGFFRLGFSFAFVIREVYYIQDLTNVPSVCKASLPTPINPPDIVLSMWHTTLLP